MVFVFVPGALLVSQPGVHTMFRQRASQGSLRLQSCVLETGNNKEGVCAGIDYFVVAFGTGSV